MHECRCKNMHMMKSFFSSSVVFFAWSLMYFSLPSMREMRAARSLFSWVAYAPLASPCGVDAAALALPLAGALAAPFWDWRVCLPDMA